tara:strand:+ start:9012 stop:9584 length:573 start_codon:yes stop_codon:yes gene_type:complete
MQYFEELDLPKFTLYEEFNSLMSSGKIHWYYDKQDQICINSTKRDPDNFLLGRCSLFYDWDKSYTDKSGKLVVPRRQPPIKEKNFTHLCSAFKGTQFEEVFNILNSKYKVGRIRIMNSQPKTCLSWHKDDSTRIHYPMKTQDGCLMVIEDEVKHLEKNTWYHTNTTVKHTAMNASKEQRLHLVACVLEEA